MRYDGCCKPSVDHGDECEQDAVHGGIPRLAATRGPPTARDLEQHDGHGGFAPCCRGETKGTGDVVEEDQGLCVGI